jgi:HAD superfamily hydrolase (TIGR01549 family)
MPYRVVFFDIGDTLGRAVEGGGALQLHPFATTVSLLQSFGAVLGLRLGIITNSGPFGPDDIRRMLERAGLANFFEPVLVVTSAEADAKKPEAKIYNIAAQRAGVPIGQCLYVGDAANEVEGAQRAGMGGLLKPVPT